MEEIQEKPPGLLIFKRDPERSTLHHLLEETGKGVLIRESRIPGVFTVDYRYKAKENVFANDSLRFYFNGKTWDLVTVQNVNSLPILQKSPYNKNGTCHAKRMNALLGDLLVYYSDIYQNDILLLPNKEQAAEPYHNIAYSSNHPLIFAREPSKATLQHLLEENNKMFLLRKSSIRWLFTVDYRFLANENTFETDSIRLYFDGKEWQSTENGQLLEEIFDLMKSPYNSNGTCHPIVMAKLFDKLRDLGFNVWETDKILLPQPIQVAENYTIAYVQHTNKTRQPFDNQPFNKSPKILTTHFKRATSVPITKEEEKKAKKRKIEPVINDPVDDELAIKLPIKFIIN